MPGISVGTRLGGAGEIASIFAAAETPALFVNRPLAEFMMDCNLDLDALRVPSMKRLGEPWGVVEGRAGLDTDTLLTWPVVGSMAAALAGEMRVAVEWDLA